jgi:hypothetical protein
VTGVRAAAAGWGEAPAPAWLHNMSVPSRSTLTVRREWIGGRCFDVCPRVRAAAHPSPKAVTDDWVARRLRRGGPASLLAVLIEPLDPLDTWRVRVAALQRKLVRQPDVEARLAGAIDVVLSRAGIPPRVGVFVPRGATAPPGTTCLGFVASLAVLGHRSGPLYLPSRQVDGSLIQMGEVLLVFPDDRP